MTEPKSALPLSVVINTKNAATTLEAALRSVKDLASEVVVVDMQSTDDTVKIAKKYADQVITYTKNHRYADPARNFANAQATQPWILVLDADETVPPSLATWIRSTLSQPSASTVACYWLPRQNYIFGHWVAHTGWWPDHQARLFQQGKVTWEDGVHRLPKVDGESVYLPADPNVALMHQNYPTVQSYLERLNRYTDLKAEELASGSTKQPSQPTSAIETFFNEFQSRFFHKKGFMDGTVGASLALMQGCYELAVHLKYLELVKPEELATATHQQTDVEVTALASLRGQLAYWLADTQVQRTRGWEQLVWRVRRKLRV